MDINAAKKIAIELMKKHGLTKNYWTFKFDNAKRRFGYCYSLRKTISLSRPITELNTEKEVRNTILHEIAHALVGCEHGHDIIWKTKALEIGCTGDRCYRTDEVVQPVGNYVAVCNLGAHTRYKMKMPKRKQSCGKCSRTFDPNNILVWNRV